MKKIAWMGLLFVMTLSLIFTLVGGSGSYSYFKDVEKSQGNTLQAGTWKVDQTITFDNPGDKTFGNAPFALSASASSGLPVTFSVVSGSATWDGSNLTLTGAGTVTVKASQAGNDSYNAAPDVEQIFNVAKATPTITWENPADITSGTALGGTQLNATASVEGNFLYTPAAGTVLDVGTGQTLSVEFAPTDTANYNNASATVTINVIPLSSAKEITSFSFAGLGDGVITGTSIAVTVPFGTDVTALVPTIVITGVSVNPASDVAQNFTNPVTYTVTAADGLTQSYVVTVNFDAASSVATVTSATYTVSAGGTAAETITNVPFGTAKATFLAALTKGETHQAWVDTGIADPVVTGNTLVVTAQDGTTVVTYTVTTNAAPVVLNSIAITTPATKVTYTIGEPLDITGLVITGTYSDGSSKVETITTANVTGFDSSTAVTGQVLTITVDGKTATYTVDVVN